MMMKSSLKSLERDARFTVTVQSGRGRPKILRTDSPAVALELLTNHARMAEKVTLHDEVTDVEVEA